jgi:hypothetical protein
MTAQLIEVLFNHDADDKRGSALNLRTSVSAPLPLPEWQLRADGSARQAPAAYACRTLVPQRLSIGAQIRWLGAPRAAIEVRALVAAPAADPRPGLLGEVAMRPVALGADGLSGRVLFDVRGGWVAAAAVGVHRVAWRWQGRAQPGDAWSDFALTQHEVFTTLLPPTAPWTGAPFVDANQALPWSDVLAIACRWAAGAQTPTDAATLITAHLFALGGSRFEYGCAVFGREMYTNSLLALFDCSAFVERVQGGEGNGRYVNCTDCACIVSTLANLLGAQLWQSRLGSYVPPFLTRPILTLGGARWDSPCSLGLGFMFHEVAWSGLAGEFDAVWDGSLLVNADLRPFAAPLPLLAANLGFGVPFGGLYRSMIAQPQDQWICHPLPEERRCRALM